MKRNETIIMMMKNSLEYSFYFFYFFFHSRIVDSFLFSLTIVAFFCARVNEFTHQHQHYYHHQEWNEMK